MNSDEKLYVVRGRNLSLYNAPISEYITTNEDFKKFCGDVIDLESTSPFDTLFQRCVESVKVAEFYDTVVIEDRAIQGIHKVVETEKGRVKIGFTRIQQHLIYVYVEEDERYLRGFRVFFGDLCLVNAMDFVPLDKATGFGTVEIIEHNKRKSTKGVKYIHNKVRSLLYVVDMEFDTYEEMQKDIDNPRDIDYSLVIEPVLDSMTPIF